MNTKPRYHDLAMAEYPGWYPDSLVLYPPELPAYLKHVYELKPIAGLPRDAEIVGIHSVVHAASRVSGVPGMHDPNLFMLLADHLFDVQMARYRSRYSRITFPTNATYIPPALPALVSINLGTVSGAPSDEEIIKVQDAVRAYQNLITVPSVFDPHVNMELSQHLFDLQMARHIQLANGTNPSLEAHSSAETESSIRPVELQRDTTEGTANGTSKPDEEGKFKVDQVSQLVPGIVQELMERSNQLTERFDQALEQFTRIAEQTHAPKERLNLHAERFDQLFERRDQIFEQSNWSAQQVSTLAKRSDQLVEQLAQSSTRSNQLAEQANEHAEQFGHVMRNINRVLVGIQHAIVRR
ncbi:unnamed protein product [Rhizoctonia solani]|uniref:Laminin domain protein n=1 Tax=Rhizoctonia solani TaxID=456999 RepID=A0A8H3A5A1_9AGAM|nr:unnamed protein product [Rhizoctonia solani]